MSTTMARSLNQGSRRLVVPGAMVRLDFQTSMGQSIDLAAYRVEEVVAQPWRWQGERGNDYLVKLDRSYPSYHTLVPLDLCIPVPMDKGGR